MYCIAVNGEDQMVVLRILSDDTDYWRVFWLFACYLLTRVAVENGYRRDLLCCNIDMKCSGACSEHVPRCAMKMNWLPVWSGLMTILAFALLRLRIRSSMLASSRQGFWKVCLLSVI